MNVDRLATPWWARRAALGATLFALVPTFGISGFGQATTAQQRAGDPGGNRDRGARKMASRKVEKDRPSFASTPCASAIHESGVCVKKGPSLRQSVAHRSHVQLRGRAHNARRSRPDRTTLRTATAAALSPPMHPPLSGPGRFRSIRESAAGGRMAGGGVPSRARTSQCQSVKGQLPRATGSPSQTRTAR